MATADEIKDTVRQRYAAAALAVRDQTGGCCGPAPADPGPFGAGLYDPAATADVPDAAAQVSLGCGNPTAVAELRPGEVVLDLGSGGGLDVLLAARRVGPDGRVYGLDMTDEMLELARANQAEAGVTNVEFLKGDIEDVPLPDHSVDVVISNCVINLAADKPRVLREAHRVLRPGGRFAVSDIVTSRPFTDSEREDLARWAGCLSGALTEAEYVAGLEAAGFSAIEVRPTHDVMPDVVSAIVTAIA